jgi:hypothetical protein
MFSARIRVSLSVQKVRRSFDFTVSIVKVVKLSLIAGLSFFWRQLPRKPLHRRQRVSTQSGKSAARTSVCCASGVLSETGSLSASMVCVSLKESDKTELSFDAPVIATTFCYKGYTLGK